MFVNLINRIIELSPLVEKTIDGVKYTSHKLYKVDKPMADSLSVNSLVSVVDFVKNTMGISDKIKYPLVINASHDSIEVHSQLTDNLERDLLLTASPLVPRLGMGSWIPVDEFIIKLQTCYEETPNRLALLTLVSNFMKKDSLEVIDNGFSQEVTVVSGVALQENIEIQPIIKLQPIRTFGEVDQVESLFLFRVDKSTKVSIHEADGGQWKNDARDSIVEYLRIELESLIDDGNVVVIG